MRKPKNYARFYALLKQMRGATKETLVASFTNNRTTSLTEMSLTEYKTMCDKMAKEVNGGLDIKAKRSAVLIRLQRLEIDTTNWDQVDEFCSQSRIAGKRFRELTQEELENLIPKLEAIAKKRRKVPKPEPVPPAQAMDIIPDWQLRLMFRNMDKNVLN